MPDPTKATISATQAPALFNRSPWLTRFMLHQHFANDVPLDSEENGRMSWGKKLEPLILEDARERLSLEVTPDQAYVRRGLLGCTRDAIVVDPSLGPGALETKCVFDYRAWMQDWDGGRTAPAHYEIQLQEQMAVGDGVTPFAWGVIAVWVAGEVHYLRRDPVPDLHASIEAEARRFFDDVAAGKEPDPFGAAIELPVLNARPRDEEKLLDLSDNVALAEDVRLFEWAKGETRRFDKIAGGLKVKLLAALGDAAGADLYGGIRLRVRQSEIPGSFREGYTRTTLTAHVPSDLPDIHTDQLQADT